MIDTTHTQADVLIMEIERAAMQRGDRLNLSDEAVMNDQIGHLEALVRNLCDQIATLRGSADNQADEIRRQASSITMLNSTIRSQREQIRRQWEELADAGLMESDGEERDDIRRDCAAFARSTGAGEVLSG
jgi:chromosome segregation ATPase